MSRFKFQISRLIMLAAALSPFFVCSSCSKTVPDKSDSASNAVRIISMAPNITEILFALGLDNEIVAITQDSDYPPAALKKQNVGTFWQPDIEAVLACRPTLVITESFPQQSAFAVRLNEVGCKTLVVDIWDFDQLCNAIDIIGKAVNREKEAGTMVDRLRSKKAQISDRRQNSANKPRVLWVIQRQPLRAAGSTAFTSELIAACGGVNAITESMYKYPPISFETVLAVMPDVIIEPTEEDIDPASQLEAAKEFYSKLSAVPAVRDQRIYVLDADKVSRLGPRLDQGMELIEQCLWPGEKD